MFQELRERICNSFKELNGKTMALVKGFPIVMIEKKDFPDINIYPTNNALEILTAVSTKSRCNIWNKRYIRI